MSRGWRGCQYSCPHWDEFSRERSLEILQCELFQELENPKLNSELNSNHNPKIFRGVRQQFGSWGLTPCKLDHFPVLKNVIDLWPWMAPFCLHFRCSWIQCATWLALGVIQQLWINNPELTSSVNAKLKNLPFDIRCVDKHSEIMIYQERGFSGKY